MNQKVTKNTVYSTKYKYLQRYKDIIDKIGKTYGMSSEDIEGLIDHFFLTIKKFITDPRMPKIQITNFGTFRPAIGKINWHLKIGFHHYRRGNIDRNRMVDKVKQLWPIRRRLMRESKGESTWMEWRNLNKDKKNDKK